MTFYKYLILIILLVVACKHAHAQPYLILNKTGTLRKSVYQPGDLFSFELKNDKQRKNLVIKELREDTIVFTGGDIDISEIGTVYIKNDFRSWNPTAYSSFFIVAGAGYIGLGAVNDKKVSANTMATSAALVSTGILINIFKRKKVKVEDRIRLAIQEKL